MINKILLKNLAYKSSLSFISLNSITRNITMFKGKKFTLDVFFIDLSIKGDYIQFFQLIRFH